MAGNAVLYRDGPVSAPLDYTVPQSGELLPLTVEATIDGTNATQTFYAVVQVLDPSGKSMGKYRSDPIAAGGSADVTWFPGAELEEAAAANPQGVIVETFYVPSNTGTPVTSSTVLQSGRPYILTVQGTYTDYNQALTFGSPQPDAMFPTSTAGRITTEVGIDAECIFASTSAFTPGHTGAFQLNLGDGLGMRHIEPEGGPFSTPQPNFFYTYSVTGAGATIQSQIFDSVYTDNYGKLLVTIQTVGGGSGGGGAGSLMPDPSLQPNGAWLRTASGTAVWSATPQVAETDMTLSDVTTQNVSTTKHGFAPKAPNDATKFLDGTGVYSTPASSSSPLTTKGDLFGYSTVNARVPVGSNNQVLVADSSQALGLKWAAVPPGSGGAMTLICSLVLSGSQASFDTNTILGGSIPASYNHLKIELVARFDEAGANDFAGIQFNADTGSNYDWLSALATGNVVSVESNTAGTFAVLGRTPASGATANRFSVCTITIPMYAGTTADKAYTAVNHAPTGTTAATIYTQTIGGVWRNTAAITRITITNTVGGNFVAGSAFYLYGIT